MMDGGLLAALVFAGAAGAATFFAPCSYALLPGYVGYYVAATGGERAPLSGAVARGLGAAAGAIATLGALSAAALAAGEALQRMLPVLEYGVGVGLVVLGAWVVYAGPGAFHVVLPRRRSTVWGFAVFGAAYALAATACVLPLFLAIALGSLAASPSATVAVLGAYAGVFAVLMVAVTIATAVGHGLGVGRFADHVDRIVRVAGLLIVLAGLGQLAVALGLVSTATPVVGP